MHLGRRGCGEVYKLLFQVSKAHQVKMHSTPVTLLILLLATLHVGSGQVQDDLALAETRAHGYFKGYGFGEFGFKDHDEGARQEEKQVSFPVDKKPAEKQERDNTREEADKGDEEQQKKLFEAFRDFYYKAKKQDEEQNVKLESAKPKKEQQENEKKKEEPKQAISYAYSTIEHNRFFKKGAERKAEQRSDDQDYYYYIRQY
ncbi:uncharacterized protein LOC135938545 [Cloeon dipterum]|uniref:uncharacterized protein LOC135938545 n=1 Tax=Cloeon dipterum TaxID=197152 RepID=UPI00321F78F8